jgi:hypothetical protein
MGNATRLQQEQQEHGDNRLCALGRRVRCAGTGPHQQHESQPCKGQQRCCRHHTYSEIDKKPGTIHMRRSVEDLTKGQRA